MLELWGWRHSGWRVLFIGCMLITERHNFLLWSKLFHEMLDLRGWRHPGWHVLFITLTWLGSTHPESSLRVSSRKLPLDPATAIYFAGAAFSVNGLRYLELVLVTCNLRLRRMCLCIDETHSKVKSSSRPHRPLGKWVSNPDPKQLVSMALLGLMYICAWPSK